MYRRYTFVVKHYLSTGSMKQVQNCFEYTLKRHTFEGVASVLAVV